jgi:hypothetical protein
MNRTDPSQKAHVPSNSTMPPDAAVSPTASTVAPPTVFFPDAERQADAADRQRQQSTHHLRTASPRASGLPEAMKAIDDDCIV